MITICSRRDRDVGRSAVMRIDSHQVLRGTDTFETLSPSKAGMAVTT